MEILKVIENVKLLNIGVVNRNNRYFTDEVVDTALDNEILKEKLKNGAFFGECCYPVDDSIARQMSVDMEQVSHRVVNLRKESDGLYGDVEILDTVAGRDIKSTMEQLTKSKLDNGMERQPFAMRSNAKVTTLPNDVSRVDDLTIVSFDFVPNPSTV